MIPPPGTRDPAIPYARGSQTSVVHGERDHFFIGKSTIDNTSGMVSDIFMVKPKQRLLRVNSSSVV